MKANSLLSDKDDFIMLSEAKVDRRVIAYIRLYLFEEVSIKEVPADDAIRIVSVEPNEVQLFTLSKIVKLILSGVK